MVYIDSLNGNPWIVPENQSCHKSFSKYCPSKWLVKLPPPPPFLLTKTSKIVSNIHRWEKIHLKCATPPTPGAILPSVIATSPYPICWHTYVYDRVDKISRLRSYARLADEWFARKVAICGKTVAGPPHVRVKFANGPKSAERVIATARFIGSRRRRHTRVSRQHAIRNFPMLSTWSRGAVIRPQEFSISIADFVYVYDAGIRILVYFMLAVSSREKLIRYILYSPLYGEFYVSKRLIYERRASACLTCNFSFSKTYICVRPCARRWFVGKISEDMTSRVRCIRDQLITRWRWRVAIRLAVFLNLPSSEVGEIVWRGNGAVTFLSHGVGF